MLTEPGGVTGTTLIPCCFFDSPKTVFDAIIAVVPRSVALKKLRREKFRGSFCFTQSTPGFRKGGKDSAGVIMVLVLFVFSLRESLIPKLDL
jgi:hypothetical protein